MRPNDTHGIDNCQSDRIRPVFVGRIHPTRGGELMRLAVVGFGRWGQNVIRTLVELENEDDIRLTDVVHAGDPTRAARVQDHTDPDRTL